MDDDPDPNSTRVQELWFSDGNLVIQAGNRRFRVYKALLAARSSVFADMLSLPQSEAAETVEGSPFVRLQDSPADTTHFLRAIFDSECS